MISRSEPCTQLASSFLLWHASCADGFESPACSPGLHTQVGLHKDRYVFPVNLCVTKLSGTGSEVVFLAVLRPAPVDSGCVRVWIAPNGLVLCTDSQFSSVCGEMSQEMVGRNWWDLGTDEQMMRQLVRRIILKK